MRTLNCPAKILLAKHFIILFLLITQTRARLTIILYTIYYTDVCMRCCYKNVYTLSKHDDNDIIRAVDWLHLAQFRIFNIK